MLEIKFLFGLEKVLLQMKKNKAHQYASDYLHLHDRPAWIPIIQIYEGKEGYDFNKFVPK